MSDERVMFRVHAIQRMFEREITADDVRHILATGRVVEDYPDDAPYLSRLILGWRGARPLHVVVAANADDGEKTVITVYEPDPDQWQPDFKRRNP